MDSSRPVLPLLQHSAASFPPWPSSCLPAGSDFSVMQHAGNAPNAESPNPLLMLVCNGSGEAQLELLQAAAKQIRKRRRAAEVEEEEEEAAEDAQYSTSLYVDATAQLVAAASSPPPTLLPCSLQVPLSCHFSLKNACFSCPCPLPPTDHQYITSLQDPAALPYNTTMHDEHIISPLPANCCSTSSSSDPQYYPVSAAAAAAAAASSYNTQHIITNTCTSIPSVQNIQLLPNTLPPTAATAASLLKSCCMQKSASYIDPILTLENSFSTESSTVMIQSQPPAANPDHVIVPPSFPSSVCVPDMIGKHHLLHSCIESLLVSHSTTAPSIYPVGNPPLQYSSASTVHAPYRRHKPSFPSETLELLYTNDIRLNSPPPLNHSTNEAAAASFFKEPNIFSDPPLHFSVNDSAHNFTTGTILASPSGPPNSTQYIEKSINVSKTTVDQLDHVDYDQSTKVGHLHLIGSHDSTSNIAPAFNLTFPSLEGPPKSSLVIRNEHFSFHQGKSSSSLCDHKEANSTSFINHNLAQEISLPFQKPGPARSSATTFCDLDTALTSARVVVEAQQPHDIEHTSSSDSSKLQSGYAEHNQDGMPHIPQFSSTNHGSSSTENAATASPADNDPIISPSPICHEIEANAYKESFSCPDAKPNDQQPSAKKRRNKVSVHPQGVAARRRRHRISNKFKVLQTLVPGGTKMDTASMLDEAIEYIKYLRHQIWLHQLLEVSQMFSSAEGDPASLITSQLPLPIITSNCTSTLDFPGSNYLHHINPSSPPAACGNNFGWPTFHI